MEETQTTATSKEQIVTISDGKPVRPNDSSTILGVSIRGWIAIAVVLTVCIMSGLKVDIKEPMYTLAGTVVGFYFGQNPKKSV